MGNGPDNRVIFGASCGWIFDFQVPFDATIEVTFDWEHDMSLDYEPDEFSDIVVLFDKQDVCPAPANCQKDVSRLFGRDNPQTGRAKRMFSASANTPHSVAFALWNDLRTFNNEVTTVYLVCCLLTSFVI